LFGESKCFELNQIALMIWNELNGENTFDEIVCKISKEYNIDKDIVSKDAKNFIYEMVGKGVILEGE